MSAGFDAERVAAHVAAVMSDSRGREIIARAYGLLAALLTGDLAPLRELQARFRFVNVVGAARSGGSYLTAELYRALGMTPQEIPAALAHDSFPEAGPFELRPGANSWLISLKTLAEYLIMVELFFEREPRRGGKVVVPKKLTKAAYAGGLFRTVLGEGAEWVLTVRHPVAACVSTYEKSGGLPADGRFRVRSNIEAWCCRDAQNTLRGRDPLHEGDYFEVYLRFWEQYQISLATSGLCAAPDLHVVAFGRDTLETLAQRYHTQYGSGMLASNFTVSDAARTRHPQWVERSQNSLERVAAAWKAVGAVFPAEQISECW